MISDVEKKIVSNITECIDKIAELPDKVKKEFRNRAREMPSELFTRGFAYMITLSAARSSSELIEVGLKASSCKDLVERLKESPKINSYALYGALVIYTLKQTGIYARDTILGVIKDSLNNLIIDQYATVVVEWIKRLAEACISE